MVGDYCPNRVDCDRCHRSGQCDMNRLDVVPPAKLARAFEAAEVFIAVPAAHQVWVSVILLPPANEEAARLAAPRQQRHAMFC